MLTLKMLSGDQLATACWSTLCSSASFGARSTSGGRQSVGKQLGAKAINITKSDNAKNSEVKISVDDLNQGRPYDKQVRARNRTRFSFSENFFNSIP